MNPVTFVRYAIWLGLTAVGSVFSGGSGFLIVRGPLLGGKILEPGPLMVSTGVFVVGVIVLTLGGTKLGRLVHGNVTGI